MDRIDLGSALTLVGLALTWLLYQLQRASDRAEQRDAARFVLSAVESGLTGPHGWGRVFFTNKWIGDDLERRARQDHDAVLTGRYIQVYSVPTEPLEALIESPVAGDLIRSETIGAACMALFKIGAFNQLVRQQTDFYAHHLAEIAEETLPPDRRRTLALAAYAQSRMLHGEGIGAASAQGAWFSELTQAVAANIEMLGKTESWWSPLSVRLALVFVVLTVVVAVGVAL